MNKLDKDYLALCQDIFDNGTKKETRNGGTISVFGRQIRHSMKDGFPLLTTKKMAFKTMVTELLWFLRGDTNIKYLVDNNCHIWDGDAYKKYEKAYEKDNSVGLSLLVARMDGKSTYRKPTKEQFIDMIQADDEFAKTWGELGPIYGKQWRSWGERRHDSIDNEYFIGIDQITNLINKLKNNPDDRRMIVTAWNPSEVESCVLPPCHYGFQVYTRELSNYERNKIANLSTHDYLSDKILDEHNIPTRAISLMWNQRSVDTPLGLPFNIASYGLLLEIIAKIVNMVPDELIGDLGDVHIYSNQIDGVKEQIGRKYTLSERMELWEQLPNKDVMDFPIGPLTNSRYHDILNSIGVPRTTRDPYPLPTLRINTEFWLTKSGECGVGELSDNIDALIKGMEIEDFQIENYQSHPAIKMPLSN